MKLKIFIKIKYCFLYSETIKQLISPLVFYLLKESYSIVNAISDMKTQKIMVLIELLDHTRLLRPGDLVKQGKSARLY